MRRPPFAPSRPRHACPCWSVAAALLACAVSARADVVPINGRVVDGLSGRAVTGAEVIAWPAAGPVRTGSDGAFSLLVAGTGDAGCRLRVTSPDHEFTEQDCGAPGEPLVVVLLPRVLRLHDEVVVTTSREPVSTLEAPRAVTVVDRRQLEREWPRTTPEALMDAAGVLVQKTNHGGGSPIVRGMMGNQLLAMVDGIRLNNATYRYGPNQYLATVDPGSIERIEVLRGSGSVLFGSDAIGGVVHVITRDPRETGPSGLAADANARLVSSGMERSGRVDVSGAMGGVRWLGGLAVRDYGDLDAGGDLGVEAPSAYTEINGDLKLLVPAGDTGRLVALYQHVHQSDVPRFDQVRQRGFARYAFDPQVRQLGYVRWSGSPGHRWAARIEATGSLQRSFERRERQRAGQSLLIVEQDDVRSLGASVQAIAVPRAPVTVRYGIDAYRDTVGSMREDRELASGTVTPRRGLYPDGATSWSAAGFGHASLDLARTTVEGGVRFTATGLRAEDSAFGVIDLGPSAWVGSAGLSHAVASHVRLYAQVSQSLRAPNIDDVSTLGSFDFGVEVPSPALEPERGLDVEGGVKARTSRAAAALAIYRLSLSNLIDRVRATFDGSDLYEGQAVYRRQNVGEAYVRGVEAEAQLEPATGWIIHGHVTSTFGQQTTTAQPMRRIPPLHGLLAVRWAARRGFVEAAARGAASQRRLAPGDRADHRMNPDGTPAWATLDVRASLRAGRSVTLTGAIENVTDEGYRIHGSGIDEPGRVAWIGITLEF